MDYGSRMRRHLPLLLVLMLVGGPAANAVADDQLSGIASVYWRSKVQTMTTDGCVVASGTTCALFPAGNSRRHRKRVVVSKFGSTGDCCWVGDPAVTLNGGVVNSGGEFATGPCAGMRSEYVGDITHDRPSRTAILDADTPGGATGLCPNAVGPAQSSTTAGAGDVLYASCVVGTSCAAAYGGGTCVPSGSLSPAQVNAPGWFLVCDQGTTISTRKERQLGPEEP